MLVAIERNIFNGMLAEINALRTQVAALIQENLSLQSALEEDEVEASGGDLWSTSAPNEPGIYMHRCGETDGAVEEVRVYKKLGNLMVNVDIGEYEVQTYHDGLTDSVWLKMCSLPD